MDGDFFRGSPSSRSALVVRQNKLSVCSSANGSDYVSAVLAGSGLVLRVELRFLDAGAFRTRSLTPAHARCASRELEKLGKRKKNTRCHQGVAGNSSTPSHRKALKPDSARALSLGKPYKMRGLRCSDGIDFFTGSSSLAPHRANPGAEAGRPGQGGVVLWSRGLHGKPDGRMRL